MLTYSCGRSGIDLGFCRGARLPALPRRCWRMMWRLPFDAEAALIRCHWPTNRSHHPNVNQERADKPKINRCCATQPTHPFPAARSRHPSSAPRVHVLAQWAIQSCDRFVECLRSGNQTAAVAPSTVLAKSQRLCTTPTSRIRRMSQGS
jgi:hypothetical protein